MNKKTTTQKKFITKPTVKSKNKSKTKNESISLATRSIKGYPLYILVFVLWGTYLFMTFSTPPNPHSQIKLSPEALFWLRLSVAVPYLFTWMAAAYSLIKIKRYAVAIKPSIESGAFNNIAWGITIMLCSLIFSTFLGSARNFFIGYPEMRAPLTILNNYSYVFPYLLAFLFLLKGAFTLARRNGTFQISIGLSTFFAIPLIALAYLWLELIFSNQYRVIAGGGSDFASYYLKDSVLILTIVFPALITWVVGLLAVMQLRTYYKKVTGIIYRRALSSLFYGFVSVIFASIFFQALLSLGARRLLDLGLEKLLLLIYIFLLLQALGFIFISRGARKLTKIVTV